MSTSSTHRNICIIGPFPEDVSVIKGGVQASVYGMARTFRLHDGIKRLKVFSLPLDQTSPPATIHAQVEGTDVTYLGARRFHAMAVTHLPLILRHISASGSPVVHIHGTGLLQAALLAALRTKGVKYVWTLHGITEKETLQKYRANRNLTNLTRHFLYKMLERFSLKTAPHILVDTPYVAETIQTPNTVSVIPQGGIFREEFTRLRKYVRYDPTILSIGVLKPRKGHHLTLEAFALLKRTVPDARIVIAGASPDTGYYEALRQQAEKLGISTQVEWLINQPRDVILKHYSKARIFALHSQEESQGLALCEALAAGLPVAATRCGGIPHVVTEGETGLLVEYGDVEGFAASMATLLQEGPSYEKMSQAAINASIRYDWKNITNEIIKIYDSL